MKLTSLNYILVCSYVTYVELYIACDVLLFIFILAGFGAAERCGHAEFFVYF
jgi:hypothetical protein